MASWVEEARPNWRHVTREAMKAPVLSFWAAVAFLVAGLIWGLVMGISQDFSTMPAHAHLNLLGWVSLFLFGIYYRCIRGWKPQEALRCRSGSGLSEPSSWRLG